MTEMVIPYNSYLALHESLTVPDSIRYCFPCVEKKLGLCFYHNFTDRYHLAKDNGSLELLVLGHIYNPFKKIIAEDAVQDLLNAYAISKEFFYEVLAEQSGRFVIFIRNSGLVEVVADASASLPVNYYLAPLIENQKIALSSHSYYLKEILSLSSCAVVSALTKTRFYQLGIRHCPADLTEVANIKRLTPNVALSYFEDELETHRIFPRRNREEGDVNEVVSHVSQALSNAVDCLNKFEKPVFCALSGGVDSRITLAATVDYRHRFRFFTFSGDGNASRDLHCTKELAKGLALKFDEIRLSTARPSQEFQNIYLRLQGETRAPNAQEAFSRQQHFGMHNSFEVRSSISEVSRNFIKRKFHVDRLLLTADAMVPIYKRVPFSKKWHDLILQAFDAWMEASSFHDVERYGYDWLDFYYWEFRVGTWQSLVLQDADYYTNPTVLFNNRKMLELMLSVPEKYRQDDSLQKMIMSRLDSRVLQTPIVKNFGKKAILREAVEANYLRAYQVLIAK